MSRLQPYWRLTRAALREQYLLIFENLGSLYGSTYEETEAQAIRAECEAVGLPMGYGRVGKAPRPLDIEQPDLFNNWRQGRRS